MHSKESTTFMECKFNRELWQDLWTETKKHYDDINPSKPNHLDPNIKNLKASLEKYISTNVTLICELPSITAFESDQNINYRIKTPYKNGPLHKAKNVTEKSHELSQKKLQKY